MESAGNQPFMFQAFMFKGIHVQRHSIVVQSHSPPFHCPWTSHRVAYSSWDIRFLELNGSAAVVGRECKSPWREHTASRKKICKKGNVCLGSGTEHKGRCWCIEQAKTMHANIFSEVGTHKEFVFT